MVAIVRQEQRIAAVIRRYERDEQQDVVGPLLHDDAVPAHFIGQSRQRKLDAVVDVEHRGVDVRADIEGRGDRQVAGGGGAGVEVQQVLDTGEPLLDRCGNCLRDRLGARARIACVDDDRRRSDVRVLRDRQRDARHEASDHDNDRNDAGQHRSLDKELREHVSSPRRSRLELPSPVQRPRRRGAASSGCPE